MSDISFSFASADILMLSSDYYANTRYHEDIGEHFEFPYSCKAGQNLIGTVALRATTTSAYCDRSR
jgi:hypothetical protein